MTDAKELAAKLNEACIDFTGEQIVDESTPRYELAVREIREAAALILSQAERVERLERILSTPDVNAPNYCEGADDPEDRCPRHPSDCVCIRFSSYDRGLISSGQGRKINNRRAQKAMDGTK